MRDILAEGLSSGEPVTWEKDAFLKKLKLARWPQVKTVKLTPKASQDLEDIWYYGYQHFREEQADRYISKISGIYQVLSDNNIGTPRPELREYICALQSPDVVKLCPLPLKADRGCQPSGLSASEWQHASNGCHRVLACPVDEAAIDAMNKFTAELIIPGSSAALRVFT